jgi:hypothetical protein
MMSCAYDLAYYIANTLGKGSLANTVFCNWLPDEPTNCIAVYEYGGSQSDAGMGVPDAAPLENVTVQVVVRNANAVTAQATAYDVYKSLDGLGDVTINGVDYRWMRAAQPPFLLSREDKEVMFTFNMEVQKGRS